MCERISWLDGWRGVACYLMVVYHFIFDLLVFGWIGWDVVMSWPLVLLEKFIAYSFILCAGVSANFTHSNLRRGLVTCAAGLVVVGASFVVRSPILFGVLQFLGLAMLVYAAVGKAVRRVPMKLAPFLWLGLFVATHILTEAVLVEPKWLYWLGFKYDGFVSYDYFPMLPYIFLFFLGSWLGQLLQAHREDWSFLGKQAPKWLTWPGRRTLWIYLLHQPVLYAACAAAYFAF